MEIVNIAKHWNICKRDGVGKFFALKPIKDSDSPTSIIKVVDKAESITRSPVIFEFLNKEKDWAMLKHQL